MKDFTIQIVSHRPNFVKMTQSRLGPMRSHHFDGTGYPSFSKLVNDAVLDAPTERVIISGDKVEPTPDHVDRLLELLEEGFGLVAMYRFGFFGFDKQLFRAIGPFDERFIGGWCEDDDYMRRMREADIAIYLSEEVPYFAEKSSWPNDGNVERFQDKWSDVYGRKDSDQYGEYDWGPPVERSWKRWEESVLLPNYYFLRYQSSASKLAGD